MSDNLKCDDSTLAKPSTVVPALPLRPELYEGCTSDETWSHSIKYTDIVDARYRIKNVAIRSPTLSSDEANRRTGAEIFFKCENLQRSGAFKFRGAYNALAHLNTDQKKRGVVTFSSGNHGHAVALAASLLNISVIAVMPQDAPAIKLKSAHRYGADVITYDRDTEDRQLIAQCIADQSGRIVIPPYDHPDVIAGQGTVAMELFEDVGSLDYLIIGIGGGSLIAGSAIVARQLAPNCRVIGVEPLMGNDAQLSLKNGRRIKINVPKTIADGAGTQQIGQTEFCIISSHIASILTVSDDQLREQMSFFAEHMKILVEPTGCLAAAAAMAQMMDISGKRVGVIVTGGNVDTKMFCNYVYPVNSEN